MLLQGSGLGFDIDNCVEHGLNWQGAGGRRTSRPLEGGECRWVPLLPGSKACTIAPAGIKVAHYHVATQVPETALADECREGS